MAIEEESDAHGSNPARPEIYVHDLSCVNPSCKLTLPRVNLSDVLRVLVW